MIEKELDVNTTVIEIATDLVTSGDLISDFTQQYYSDNEITREYELKNNNVFRLDFGYEIDGCNRLLGTYIFNNKMGASCIIINNFAKENFIKFMNLWKVGFEIIE